MLDEERVVQHRLDAAPREAARLGAVEPVLGLVKVTAGEGLRGERDGGDDDAVQRELLVVALGARGELGELVEHVAVRRAQMGERHRVGGRVKVVEVAEHEAARVAQPAIGLSRLAEHALPHRHVGRPVTHRHPPGHTCRMHMPCT